MSHFAFVDGVCLINGVALSAHCTGFDADVETRMVEDGPCMGQIHVKSLPVIKSTGPITVRFKQDFAGSQVHATIFPLWHNAGALPAAFTYALKATSAADGPTNPNLTGTGYLTRYAVLRGNHGEVVGTEIVITPGGATPGLTEDVTP